LRGTSKGDYIDCRMLMLICGGAVGYPSLRDHALISDPERLYKDMEEGTYNFLIQKRNLSFDKASCTLMISPFFQWYDSIFQQSFEEPFDFAIHYKSEKIKFNALDFHLKRVYNTNFDWRINDIATKDKD